MRYIKLRGKEKGQEMAYKESIISPIQPHNQRVPHGLLQALALMYVQGVVRQIGENCHSSVT